ncbi:hypothetical protein RP20_CCG016400 [Aedes albopictus]|nr:hypothetical protein RP20_CCG016400 [Aedes albopictus]
MKEWSDLLREIKKFSDHEDAMEFGEDFAKLQMIFNHTNQFVRNFDKIVFHGGNEPFIIEIVARLVKYLRIRRYLNEDNKPVPECKDQLRKITLFMVLNTDVSFKYDLGKDTKLCHLLNTIPQLTKCLLINCIWGASLDEYFYEVLSYTPQWFMMQFVDQAVTSLKFSKPYEILGRVEAMVKAIYYSICRTDADWKKIDRNRFVEQQRTLGKLFDFLMEFLRYFNTPDMSKFERWTKLSMHKYHGFALKHMFGIVLYCLDMYLNKSLFKIDEKMGIYQIMGEEHVPKKEIPEQYSHGADGYLMKINNCLLNTLQTCVMEVTIDGFMYWVEIEISVGDRGEKMSLQQFIGESAFKLCEMLKDNKVLQHNVLKQLPAISLRPKSQAEKAMELSMRDLMEKLESCREVFERKLFFNEFLRRGAQVFGNAECLELIEQNMDLISGDNVRKLIEYDNRPLEQDEMESDEPAEEAVKLRQLILKSVDYLLLEEANSLIKFMIATYGLEYDRYRTPTLVEEIIEYTNRFNSASLQLGAATDDSDIPFRLIFQCPSLFYQRLTRPSRSASPAVHCTSTQVIAKTKSLAVPYLSAQVRSLLSDKFEITKSNSLSVFVLKLYNLDLFERNHFLQGYLLQGADEAFRTGNFIALTEVLGLMHLVVDKNLHCFKLDSLKQVTVKLAEISEKLRYDVTKLEPTHPQGIERVALLEKILKIMSGPVRTLRALKEESKRRFRELTEGFTPITKFYFHRTLVQCTAGEAERLGRDPVLLPHLNDSVLIILVLLVENPNHYECLKSCLTNYLHVVQKHILPPLLATDANPADRVALVKALTKLIVKLPGSTRDRLLAAMTFGLSAIMQRLRTADASLDLSEIEKVLNLDQLQSSSAAAVTSKLRHQHLNRSNSSSPTSAASSSSSSSTSVDSVAASPSSAATDSQPQPQINGTKEEDTAGEPCAMVTE